MKRLLALILAFSVNAFGATAIPNIFATQPSGNVPASYLDTNFALISNYNTFSNYLVDSGAANAYVVTFPAGTTGSLAAGLLINFKAGADNTGASTLAVNGMTAKNITNYDATALAAGQIKAGAIVSVIYDGTQFKLAGQPGGVAPANLTPQATNTVLGNATSGTAVPTALAVGTCSTASSALIWTTNTGFGCNTSITANTAATATTATNFNNGTSSSSGGTVTATTFSGALSGNASTATTAGTVTTAAQPAITSVGALTGGSIGSGFGAINIGSNSLTAGAISGTTGTFSGGGTDQVAILKSTAGAYATFQKGTTDKGYIGLGLGVTGATTDSMIVRGVADVQIAAGSSTIVSTFSSTGLSVTGTTSSTAFSGPLTGNVTGNVSGTAATVTGAAQSAITSVGTLTGLSSSSYKDGAGNLIISSTAPAIASGFGTSPSILANNTAAFQVTVGTATSTTYYGTLTMPAAPNGWVCNVQNVSTPTISSRQTASSTTSVSISDFSSSTNNLIQWLTGDVLLFQCTAF